MHFLAAHPEYPFGVHLTVSAEGVDYRWGSVTPREKVASLVDPAGYFYNFDQMPELLAQVQLDQLEMEFRAQIESVLAAGLKPTHLDWHALRLGGRANIFGVMFRLAKEYQLALRVAGQSMIADLQSQGWPTNDDDFLDSFEIDPIHKAARYAQLLNELPVGLNEWAVTSGLDTRVTRPEPDGNHVRQTDFDFWTSPQAKDLVQAEGIILLDYRALQVVWRGK